MNTYFLYICIRKYVSYFCMYFFNKIC
uniref:Uncharacterized protein n=1 Tax=Anguilla anguilla TaxID=7936 RepID=A0A0E9S395_ANGAN